jgi:hypothetical protein
MPRGIDWVHFIYVNLGFVAQVFVMYYFTAVEEVKKNWSLYRCNPLFMPLSDDIEKDFVYCIQNVQTNFMGYLLEPLTYITSGLTFIGKEFTQAINFVRKILSNIRSFIASIIQNIFGVFLNLITEFQKIIIGIKDLMGKIIGIIVSLMYVMDGSIKTMNSAWNGPPGQMVQALGHCFHPDTKVQLKNGNIIFMKELNLGDILENGSRVNGIMKLDNSNKQHKLYKYCGKGVNKESIYVTGSHYVKNKDGKFIQVKEDKEAVEQDEVTCETLSCLIIDDHKIQIGEKIFWDWDDYLVKYNV